MITCESCDKSLTLKVDGFENGRIEITDLKSSNQEPQANTNQEEENNEKDKKNVRGAGYFFPHVGPVTSIAFGSIDEVPCFISTGADGKVILWKNLSGAWTQKILYKSKIPVTSAYFSSESSLIVFADQNGEINFINTENEKFEINEELKISTKVEGIHQVCFIILSTQQKDIECLAVITPTGELLIYKEKNNKYSEKPFSFQFSKSYVKGISPLDRCYIAGICFGNIVRVFDIKMFSISEINLKIGFSKEDKTEDKIFYANDNPIFALRWQEALRNLVICEQKTYQIKEIAKANFYTIPTIVKEEYIFTKDPLGTWTKLPPKPTT
ncbi:hypothetical protein M9Y10_013331 [Tritrichomonas musculus]|uniref:Uncharacterized protein n=1 Tax=Tritrichomonas musculus TaxID=1915356 RepID=A0ABR2I917_9EUKA